MLSSEIFSREKVNLGRQSELDLGKAIIIFFMIFIHVCEVGFSYLWEDLQYCSFSLWWVLFWISIVSLVPFMFMFSMGSTMVYAPLQRASELCKRGVYLICSWFILHLTYVYPMDKIFVAKLGCLEWQFVLAFMMASDILFFAGLFFIFYGCLRWLKFGLKGIVVVALVLFTVSHFIEYKNDTITLMDSVMGNFVITGSGSFPFLHWVIVPTLGLCWGTLLQHCYDKDKLYLRMFFLGLIGMVVYLLVLYTRGILTLEFIESCKKVSIFYNVNVYTVIFSSSLLAVFLSICYYIVTRFCQPWFAAIYSFLSKELTTVYFIQWMLIPWLVFALPRVTEKMSFWVPLSMAGLVLLLDVMIVKVYIKFRSVWRQKNC